MLLLPILAFPGLWPTFAIAEQPAIGTVHPLKSGLFGWKIDERIDGALSVVHIPSGKVAGRYALGPCVFCSGEDDNCERDGIQEINFSGQDKEPLLAVACHVGAHSQRLTVYAPLRDPQDPVFTATGAYWIDY